MQYCVGDFSTGCPHVVKSLGHFIRFVTRLQAQMMSVLVLLAMAAWRVRVLVDVRDLVVQER